MTDYALLQEEIQKPQYAGMTDAEIAAHLTAPITVGVDADPAAAYHVLMQSSTYDWARVVTRSHMPLTGTGDDVVLAAINTTSAFQSTTPVLHTTQSEDLAKLQNDLDLLVGAGDVSSASSDAVMALTQKTTTQAEEFGFDPAIHDMEQEIAAARIWTP